MMNILLINQNATVEKLVKLSAQKVGLEVESVESLDDAVAGDYKWVLVDNENLQHHLPSELRSKFNNAKVGLLYPKNGEKIDDFDLYIEKPFLPTELIDEFSSHMGDGDAGSDELGTLSMELPDLEDDFAELPSTLDMDSDDKSVSADEGGSVLDKEEVDRVKELLDSDDAFGVDSAPIETDISFDEQPLNNDEILLDEPSVYEALDLAGDISLEHDDLATTADDMLLNGDDMEEVADLTSTDMSNDDSLPTAEEVSFDGSVEEDSLSLSDGDTLFNDESAPGDVEFSFDEQPVDENESLIKGSSSDDELDLAVDSELECDEPTDIEEHLSEEMEIDREMELSGDEIGVDDDSISKDHDLSFEEQIATVDEMPIEEEEEIVDQVLDDEESFAVADGLSSSSDTEEVKIELGNNTALLNEDELLDLHKNDPLEDEALTEDLEEIGMFEDVGNEADLEDNFEGSRFDFTEQSHDELESIDEDLVAEALGEEIVPKADKFVSDELTDELEQDEQVELEAFSPESIVPSTKELDQSSDTVATPIGNISTGTLKELLDGMQLTINISFPSKK